MRYRWVGLREFMRLSREEAAQVALDLNMDDEPPFWRSNHDLDDAEEYIGEKQEMDL